MRNDGAARNEQCSQDKDSTRAEQRRRKREYMRRWRAAHPEQEARIWAKRKAATVVDVAQVREADESRTACGFCGKRAPVDWVLRLRVSDEAESGYEEIRVPYCGLC